MEQEALRIEQEHDEQKNGKMMDRKKGMRKERVTPDDFIVLKRREPVMMESLIEACIRDMRLGDGLDETRIFAAWDNAQHAFSAQGQASEGAQRGAPQGPGSRFRPRPAGEGNHFEIT